MGTWTGKTGATEVLVNVLMVSAGSCVLEAADWAMVGLAWTIAAFEELSCRLPPKPQYHQKRLQGRNTEIQAFTSM